MATVRVRLWTCRGAVKGLPEIFLRVKHGIFGKKYFVVHRSADSQQNHYNRCHQLSDF